jgi:hypothetical protein
MNPNMGGIPSFNKQRAQERTSSVRATGVANNVYSLQEEAKKREQEAYIAEEGCEEVHIKSILG